MTLSEKGEIFDFLVEITKKLIICTQFIQLQFCS